MKIVNIFGLVVAVHVVVLLLIFAIPGCRSTAPGDGAATAYDSPIAPMGEEPSSPIQPAPTMSAADLNPAVAPTETAGYGGASAGGNRFSPTRPGSAPASGPASPIMPAPETRPTQTYTVVRGDSLWSVSRRHGLTVRELAAANNLNADAGLQLGQTLQIPAAAGGGTTRAGSPAAPASGNQETDTSTYTIRAGDTLGAIARRHGTTVGALRALNNLRGDLVRIGDTLQIPAGGSTPAPAQASARAEPPAASPAPAAVGGSTGSGAAMRHVVAAGETLGAIARKYGVRLGDLALANNITDPTRIRPGQELVVPGWQAPAGATPAGGPPAADTPATPATVPTQYPPSYDELPPPEDDADVPVIRVEEPVQTIQVESAGGGGGSEPPMFN